MTDRTERVELRVSPEELAAWQERAERSDQPLSAFVRDCVNRAAPARNARATSMHWYRLDLFSLYAPAMHQNSSVLTLAHSAQDAATCWKLSQAIGDERLERLVCIDPPCTCDALESCLAFSDSQRLIRPDLVACLNHKPECVAHRPRKASP
jgi:hypothetical protein